MKKNRILFLNLATFHFTGGIEKVNRCIYKALDEESISNSNVDYRAISVYDSNHEFQNRYANPKKVFNFNQSKFNASIAALWQAFFSDTILLSHINLAPIGFLIKTLFPRKKLIIMAHGIEIWGKLGGFKKMLLKKVDQIIAVSNYTKERLSKEHHLPLEKIVILNNCLDPFMESPSNFEKPKELMTRYCIKDTDFVLYTLSRLSSQEKYKGYDKVIEALAELSIIHPNLKYFIGGKGDTAEISRIESLIAKHNLQNCVKLLGYIKEEELADHFLLADAYIMPSQNEGFGIVFIEAAFYGLPIIAGNCDGSRDALLNGQLGVMINPNVFKEITIELNIMIQKLNHKNDKI
jgi:phosphatidylinositol alpha-1,6-mannosyltransferase